MVGTRGDGPCSVTTSQVRLSPPCSRIARARAGGSAAPSVGREPRFHPAANVACQVTLPPNLYLMAQLPPVPYRSNATASLPSQQNPSQRRGSRCTMLRLVLVALPHHAAAGAGHTEIIFSSQASDAPRRAVANSRSENWWRFTGPGPTCVASPMLSCLVTVWSPSHVSPLLRLPKQVSMEHCSGTV